MSLRTSSDRPKPVRHSRHSPYGSTSPNITAIIGRCVVLISCNHSFSERSHSVDVPGATGIPEAERPKGRKQPAQVKSRREAEANKATASRAPTGKVKATLLEAQS